MASIYFERAALNVSSVMLAILIIIFLVTIPKAKVSNSQLKAFDVQKMELYIKDAELLNFSSPLLKIN